MRVLVWNCSMSFRKKLDAVMRLAPDIAVIGNSEFPDKLYPGSGPKISGSLWFGNDRKSGLGIYSFGKWHIQPHPVHDASVKTLVPIECTNGNTAFLLLAFQGAPASGRQGYGKAFHDYQQALTYIEHIRGRTAIFAGEMGEAALSLWNRESVEGGYGDLEQVLAQADLRSCYHAFTRETPGRERTPTLYQGRDMRQGIHTTCCFASTDLLLGLEDVQVGRPETWLDYSEHMPLVVDFA